MTDGATASYVASQSFIKDILVSNFSEMFAAKVRNPNAEK
jgi:hypothetical protein